MLRGVSVDPRTAVGARGERRGVDLAAPQACRLVFRAASYRYVTAGLFLLALGGYAFTLPAGLTGGAIGLASVRHLTIALATFAVALAALLSLVLTLNLYGLRTSCRRRGTGLSVGAVLASLVPSSVCCTWLVPSVLAALGASTPQLFGVSGRIQGTVARYEEAFLAGAVVLLLVSLELAAREIVRPCAPAERRDRCCDSGEPSRR
jgi:hypothetical protein